MIEWRSNAARLRLESPVGLCDLVGERRVDIDIGACHASRVEQCDQVLEDHLGALERECGNDKIAAAGKRRTHYDGKRFATVVDTRHNALTIAIGRFADDMIPPAIRRHGPIGVGGAGTDIAGKQERLSIDVQLDACGAQDMVRVPEAQCDAGPQLDKPLVIEGPDLIDDGFHVGEIIERFEGLEASAIGPFVAALRVSRLQVRGVGQEGFEQLAIGWRAPDFGRAPFAHEQGQASRMIEMRVRQYDQVDAPRIERQGLVVQRFKRTRSLEQSAIDQDTHFRRPQFHARPGDDAGGPMENDFKRHHRSPVDV